MYMWTYVALTGISLQNVILKLQAMKRNRDTEENKGSLS